MQVLFLQNKKLSLRTHPKPEKDGNEALVRVIKAGICNTDIELIKGYMGFSGIPGHEFVGVVEDSEDRNLVGKRVVGEINIGCSECTSCKNGMERHCPNRKVLGIFNHDGAFAEYLVLPNKNLIPIPDKVSDDEAVFIEPLAAALEIQEQINIQKDTSICIIGDGKLGLLIAMTLSLISSRVTLIGKHKEREKLINTIRYLHIETDDVRKEQFEIVVEASGSPRGWKSAVKMVKPRGTIVLKSTYADTVSFDLAPLVIHEISVVGSRCGRFTPALNLLIRKEVNPLPLIQQRFPFNEYQKAFSTASQKGALKIFLEF